MTKAFHAGHAAQCGLVASMLASQGFTSAEDILEGPMGFLSLFGDFDPGKIEQVLPGLGKPFELSASGLAVKQYPCCAASHPVLDAVLKLREQAHGRLQEIDRIICRVHPLVPRIMIHEIPENPLQGKFSLKYCVAAAILDGKVDLESFTDKALHRPEVRRWIGRTVLSTDLDVERPEAGGIPTRAEVILQWKNGSSSSIRVERPEGSPDSPLSEAALYRKFEACASRVLPMEAVSRAGELIARLETLPSLNDLIRTLVPSGDSDAQL